MCKLGIYDFGGNRFDMITSRLGVISLSDVRTCSVAKVWMCEARAKDRTYNSSTILSQMKR